jgi:hypothetical protein
MGILDCVERTMRSTEYFSASAILIAASTPSWEEPVWHDSSSEYEVLPLIEMAPCGQCSISDSPLGFVSISRPNHGVALTTLVAYYSSSTRLSSRMSIDNSLESRPFAAALKQCTLTQTVAFIPWYLCKCTGGW